MTLERWDCSFLFIFNFKNGNFKLSLFKIYFLEYNLEQDEDLFAFYNVDLLGILFKLILSFY